ncbi:beta-glucosidase family protein [Butyrivibrio sp. AE3006]|uniref:beta-glucosidase family protein n=1 Tax=Butyrivibrio sp. AE3006 TaxID=1280673 RepID=UPI0004250F07|nr:glycoside hydrolase family 3 C-terminal domain-containing protein [Butyrivibrio sp. AE3006]
MKKDKTYRMTFDEKARQIVGELSLEEKVSLMAGNIDATSMKESEIMELVLGTEEGAHYNVKPYEAGGLPDKGVPPMKFADGPRGVVCGNNQTTCFPVSMARGATFNPALEEEIGHAIGQEVRAFGGNLFAGVCINLPYNPGWGRSQETYGEETYQIGRMGAALVKGVQSEDIMACVKHYAFNDMENARFKVSVTCDQRTEQEVYLPHFKDCVDAGCASIMSSYNRYNGVQCGHHKYLLSQVLKKEWGFDGFVMSDFCWGVLDTVEAANGGQDMEMLWTQFFGPRLVQAVKDGFVPESRIDDAAVRIVRTILAFDKDHKEYDMSVVGSKEHIELAKRAAEEAITLVKNKNVLPLDKGIKKIAVVGKLADANVIGDQGSSWVRPPYVKTPLQGIKEAVPSAEILYSDGADLDEVKKIASEADAVIYVVGYNHDDEGEFISSDTTDNYTGSIGGDRKKGLGLHDEDVKLLQETGSINEKSVVVLIGGNMIMMTDWIDKVNSVLMAYYPGMEGGTALAEIIFGDVNPSGKLPFVVPYKEEDLPKVDWEATDQYYEYYHGYARLDKNGVKPLVPYGFGLSYTTFKFSDPSVAVEGDELVAKVAVANTGDRDGAEVVQLYAGFENSAVDRPVRQLRGFEKVFLKAGESKVVTVKTPLEKLKYYNPVDREWVLEKMEYPIYIGSSEALEDLVKTQITL